ncbi:MAG: GAF domain-containing protein [Gemmatimonadaceae bacterium]
MASRQTAPPPRQEYPSEETDDPAGLRRRLAELERERDQLVAVVEILQSVSAEQHFEETLQTVARKLGQCFKLDRSSIYLAPDAGEVRLMATYEDPEVRNLIVDLERYPELKQALDSGTTVFIPDVATDPLLRHARVALTLRNVRSIIVAPISVHGAAIGAVFVRSERGAEPFTPHDVRFCQVIASLTANALRNAHRHEASRRERAAAPPGGERERILLLAFIRRMLDGCEDGAEPGACNPLSPDAQEELAKLAERTWASLGHAARS